MSVRNVIHVTVITVLAVLIWALPVASVRAMSASAMHHASPKGMQLEVPLVSTQDSLDAANFFNQGLQKLNGDDSQAAIADFTQSLQLVPDEKVYLKRGEVRHQIGDLQGAIADYTEALQGNPGFSYIYNQRGKAREALGDYQGAFADYTQAIAAYPEDGIGYSNRGALHNKLGNILEAFQDLSLAIQVNSGRADAYFYRGNFRSKLGNYQGAFADYQQAANLFTVQGKIAEAQDAIHQMMAVQQQQVNTSPLSVNFRSEKSDSSLMNEEYH